MIHDGRGFSEKKRDFQTKTHLKKLLSKQDNCPKFSGQQVGALLVWDITLDVFSQRAECG